MKKIIVTGGGAAGMMAAVSVLQMGGRVVLFEKNEKLGKKLFITGKGRCNLTNDCDMETLFQNIMTNSKFLYSVFYGFDNHAVMDWFEKADCPVKTERGGRVFPVSDHAYDVTAALERQLRKGKADIRLHTEVKRLLAEDGKIKGVELADGSVEYGDAVILATGGLSYPLTGSDGDGYRMAEEEGHTIKETFPSLVPLTIQEEWCKSLQGLSLKNVRASLFMEGKKPLYEGFGEMLFTHFGVSGPLILSASSYYGKKGKGEKAVLRLDLKPALTPEQVDKRLLRDFEENKNKQFKNSLGKLFPSKLIPVMISLSEIDGEKKVHEVTKEERVRLAHLIKDLRMTVTGTRGYAEAVITRGGIHVKEVNPSTMESKIIKGLYFAGEMLDVDALTGGFNLQIAWSTGYQAGISAVEGGGRNS